MDFKNILWNEKNYKKYQQFLLSKQDKKYQQFNSKLVTTKYEIIGIRVPIMRKIATEISKGNIEDYLKFKNYTFYEEVFIYGIVLSKIKDKEELIETIKLYIKFIDNWAICDSFCNSLKIISKNQEYFFPYIKEFIQSKEEFTIRVGLVLLLNYYVQENYINQIFEILNELHSDKYYVNMASAWLLCECYVKQKEKTIIFLQNNKIDSWVQNKAISKMKDSYRISKEEKQYLNTLIK